MATLATDENIDVVIAALRDWEPERFNYRAQNSAGKIVEMTLIPGASIRDDLIRHLVCHRRFPA